MPTIVDIILEVDKKWKNEYRNYDDKKDTDKHINKSKNDNTMYYTFTKVNGKHKPQRPHIHYGNDFAGFPEGSVNKFESKKKTFNLVKGIKINTLLTVLQHLDGWKNSEAYKGIKYGSNKTWTDFVDEIIEKVDELYNVDTIINQCIYERIFIQNKDNVFYKNIEKLITSESYNLDVLKNLSLAINGKNNTYGQCNLDKLQLKCGKAEVKQFREELISKLSIINKLLGKGNLKDIDKKNIRRKFNLNYSKTLNTFFCKLKTTNKDAKCVKDKSSYVCKVSETSRKTTSNNNQKNSQAINICNKNPEDCKNSELEDDFITWRKSLIPKQKKLLDAIIKAIIKYFTDDYNGWTHKEKDDLLQETLQKIKKFKSQFNSFNKSHTFKDILNYYIIRYCSNQGSCAKSQTAKFDELYEKILQLDEITNNSSSSATKTVPGTSRSNSREAGPAETTVTSRSRSSRRTSRSNSREAGPAETTVTSRSRSSQRTARSTSRSRSSQRTARSTSRDAGPAETVVPSPGSNTRSRLSSRTSRSSSRDTESIEKSKPNGKGKARSQKVSSNNNNSAIFGKNSRKKKSRKKKYNKYN